MIHSNFVQGITFCLIILQVHFGVGGNLLAEKPTKAKDNHEPLSRARCTGELEHGTNDCAHCRGTGDCSI
jgi:hypothetical protein